MAAEELVEAVLTRDVHGEPAALAPRAAPHLAQAGDGTREVHADRCIELADVDPELEGVGRRHRQELALGQVRFDLAALLRRVAGAVGGDPFGEVSLALLGQLQRGHPVDQLDPAAALHEADRPHTALDELAEHVGCLGDGGAPQLGRLLDHGRVPHRDLAARPRCSVIVEQVELQPRQPLGELAGVGDRGRGHDESRIGAVEPGGAPQPAEDVRDVRAEHPAVCVGLVDDDPSEVREKVSPALVMGEDPDVEHVGVRQHQVGASPDRRPLLARGVPVVDRLAQVRRAQLAELPRLVLGEGLGRVEVEGATLRVPGDPVEDRQVERQRLPGRGAAGQDQLALPSYLERLGLV